MRKLLLIVIAILLSGIIMGQNRCSATQLIRDMGLHSVVYKSPSYISNLTLEDTSDIYDFAKEEGIPITIPKTIIEELILKTSHPDTTFSWDNSYLPDRILIKDRSDKLNFRKLCKQLSVSAKTPRAIWLKRFVDEWNNHSKRDTEYISYMSYPIFDNSCQYAIIQSGYGCGNLCGRSWIAIYKFDGSKWVQALTIKRYIS